MFVGSFFILIETDKKTPRYEFIGIGEFQYLVRIFNL